MAEASVLPRNGAMAEASRAGMPFMAQCTVNEFPYQRMHRFPKQQARPLDVSGCFDSTHKRAFRPRTPGEKAVPQFTVGRKNDLGTSNQYSQISLADLRRGQIVLGDQPSTWGSANHASYKPPDQADFRQGCQAERAGMASRLPFSEVERRFVTGDSSGTMPGHVLSYGGKAAGKARSVQQNSYERHRIGAREPQMVTLGAFNDIGSSAKYRHVPASELLRTQMTFE